MGSHMHIIRKPWFNFSFFRCILLYFILSLHCGTTQCFVF